MHLNILQRKALRTLEHVGQLNEMHLRVGQKTIKSLLEERWIERLADGVTGARYYRITDEGRTALTFEVRKIRRDARSLRGSYA